MLLRSGPTGGCSIVEGPAAPLVLSSKADVHLPIEFGARFRPTSTQRGSRALAAFARARVGIGLPAINDVNDDEVDN